MVTTSEALQYCLNRALLESKVGFDIECESLAASSTIAGFSLYLPSMGQAFYVALCHPNHFLALTFEQIDKIAALKVVTYNGGFDLCHWEFAYGKTPKVVGDASIVSKMLQLHKFGLKNLAEELGIQPITVSLENILGVGNYDFTKTPLSDRVRDYGCQDARLAIQVEEGLLAKYFNAAHHPGWDMVYALELDTMLILERASEEGMIIDREAFENAAALMEIEAKDLNRTICRELNRSIDTFAINSPKRLAAALYNAPDHQPTGAEKTIAQKEMAMPGLGLTPPGNDTSTAKDILALISDQHLVIDQIIRWKSLNAVLTRDMKHLKEFACQGILHPQFAQIGEDGTSRIYTEQPNVIALSMHVRRAMPPREGKVYCHADFKAAEWRIAALLSGETKILDALEEGIDPHCFTYSEMTRTSVDLIDKKQREIGKVLNYASLYGASSYRIALALGIDQSGASILLDDFWAAYPKLKAWIDFRKNYCLLHARTYTVLGRTRQIREVFTRNPAVKKAALRKAVNTAGQGSCGDALKLALQNIDRASRMGPLVKYNVKIRCPVFDAVLLEMDESVLEDSQVIDQLLRDELEVILTYENRSTRMKVDIGWSKNNWAEACGK